jgi:hypothetical protein
VGNNLKATTTHKQSKERQAMNNLKILNKIATFSAIAAFIITAVEASLNYFLLIIVSQGQEIPGEYTAITILTSVLPYLFFAIIAAIVAVFSRSVSETPETLEEEALPPKETELNA